MAGDLEFLLTIASGGSDLPATAVKELKDFEARCIERSGQARVFFRTARPSQDLVSLRIPEKVYVVVLRRPVNELVLPPGGQEAEDAVAALVASSDGWPAALQAWREISDLAQASPSVDAEANSFEPRSFRVTGHRAGRRAAHLSSNGLAEATGEALMVARGWRVELRDFDVQVMVNLNDESLLVMLPLLSRTSAKQQTFICRGLTQSVSWAMARSVDVEPGQVVLDPMCGCGIILLEAAQCWRGAQYVGIDNDPLQLERSVANSDVLCARLRQSVSFLLGDATCLPLATASVDAVVCDLPFGKLHGSEADNETLYPAAVAEFRRVLRVGSGRVALLTNQANSGRLSAALLAPPGLWEVTCRRKLRLGNMEAVLFLATARPASSVTGSPSSGDGGDNAKLPAETLRLPWEGQRGRANWTSLKAEVREPLEPVVRRRMVH
eukprot:TRINITY_DN62104_c0_g1_i1.p1 TRINITY_DN62104_c0_g1~~TRINITY_DN62104_c0_g1_i1.p1  ORF type:complete len:439 (-),score=83.32 TRINITY_DN62104_c0_g1_i1:71-1387(-)